MTDEFDSELCNLMADALHQALQRLGSLGLIDGDADRVRATLSRSILEATDAGERDVEKLVLFAMGRFPAPAPRKSPETA